MEACLVVMFRLNWIMFNEICERQLREEAKAWKLRGPREMAEDGQQKLRLAAVLYVVDSFGPAAADMFISDDRGAADLLDYREAGIHLAKRIYGDKFVHEAEQLAVSFRLAESTRHPAATFNRTADLTL